MGYYGAEKQARRTPLKVKTTLSSRQECEEYKFKAENLLCRYRGLILAPLGSDCKAVIGFDLDEYILVGFRRFPAIARDESDGKYFWVLFGQFFAGQNRRLEFGDGTVVIALAHQDFGKQPMHQHETAGTLSQVNQHLFRFRKDTLFDVHTCNAKPCGYHPGVNLDGLVKFLKSQIEFADSNVSTPQQIMDRCIIRFQVNRVFACADGLFEFAACGQQLGVK